MSAHIHSINFIAFHVTESVNDYDYISPVIYHYTFLAGTVSTYPDTNISITDDLLENNDTTFQMAIIDAALPFYVYAGHPATISTSDNSKYLCMYI